MGCFFTQLALGMSCTQLACSSSAQHVYGCILRLYALRCHTREANVLLRGLNHQDAPQLKSTVALTDTADMLAFPCRSLLSHCLAYGGRMPSLSQVTSQTASYPLAVAGNRRPSGRCACVLAYKHAFMHACTGAMQGTSCRCMRCDCMHCNVPAEIYTPAQYACVHGFQGMACIALMCIRNTSKCGASWLMQLGCLCHVCLTYAATMTCSTQCGAVLHKFKVNVMMLGLCLGPQCRVCACHDICFYKVCRPKSL